MSDEQFEGFLESRVALAPGEEKDVSGLERPASVEAFADRVVIWCGADRIVLNTADLEDGESRRLTFYPKGQRPIK